MILIVWFWLFNSDWLTLIWLLVSPGWSPNRRSPLWLFWSHISLQRFFVTSWNGDLEIRKGNPSQLMIHGATFCYWRIWSMRHPVFNCPLTLLWIKVGLVFSSKFQHAMSSPQKNHKPKQDRLLFISLSLVPRLCPSFWCYWFLTTSAITSGCNWQR